MVSHKANQNIFKNFTKKCIIFLFCFVACARRIYLDQSNLALMIESFLGAAQVSSASLLDLSQTPICCSSSAFLKFGAFLYSLEFVDGSLDEVGNRWLRILHMQLYWVHTAVLILYAFGFVKTVRALQTLENRSDLTLIKGLVIIVSGHWISAETVSVMVTAGPCSCKQLFVQQPCLLKITFSYGLIALSIMF